MYDFCKALQDSKCSVRAVNHDFCEYQNITMNNFETNVEPSQESDIKKWLKKHKKEIIATGISIVAITGLVLGVKNKDTVLGFLKKCKATAKNIPSEASELAVNDAITEDAKNVYAYIGAQIPQHIRNLPEGWHHSAEKATQAKALGIDLLPNQTLVDPYTKGLVA